MAPLMTISPRVRKSPYFDATIKAGVTSFSVYNHMYMPTGYGDPEAEYERLNKAVAIWDVAVERQTEISGPDAGKLAQLICPRDLTNCKIGQGKYVPICDHKGRLLNDPVLLKLAEDRYWLSLADSDITLWVRAIGAERGLDVEVTEPDASPLAIQGPKAEDLIAELFGDWVRSLKYFWFKETDLDGIPLVVARSGWSKQGGFELYLTDGTRGLELWDKVYAAGEKYGIGPGVPNHMERTESALLSYGGDTDPDTNPFEVNLGKYVDLDSPVEFIGKEALLKIREEGPKRKQVGLLVEQGVPTQHEHKWPVLSDGREIGFLGVLAYSPRRGQPIGIALVESSITEGANVQIVGPQGTYSAEVTKLPFY